MTNDDGGDGDLGGGNDGDGHTTDKLISNTPGFCVC